MYYLFVLGKTLAQILPREVCYVIARVLAIFKFYFSRDDRKAVMYNLLPIVEEKGKIKKYTKEVFINFSYYLVDFFRYSKLNQRFIKKYVKVIGLNHIHSGISNKKGIIILTAHLGNYELGAAVTSLLGFPFHAVALSHKDRRLNDFFNHQRESVGIKVIPTGVSIKRCFSALKQGELVGLLGDRDFSRGGLKLKFFSKHAIIPRGPAFFALRTGAYIVPSFFVRESKKFYHLIFEEPIVGKDSNLEKEESTIERYISVLEKYIKKYPQQWYMFEKYWL
jgi:KDO2-lipid IV(A) lauroyltransferase